MGVQTTSFIAIIVLVYPFVAASRSNRINLQHQPLENLINLEETLDIYTVELIWANCGTELMHTMEAFQDTQSSSNDKTLLEHNRTLKSLAYQDPHVKKIISDCLRGKSVAFPESGEDKHPRKWYVEYLDYFSLGSTDSRKSRRLAEVAAPASSPSPAEAPGILKPPSPPFFPPIDPSPGKNAQSPVGFGANSQAKNGNNDNHKKIVIAVVVTATTTFLLATLLFCCYMRTCGKRRGQKDERPLLSLSLSDYSISGT